MADRPIIMDGASVRAILEGRKTQTRRVIRQFSRNPDHAQLLRFDDNVTIFGDTIPDDPCPFEIKTPYRVGDRIWVKETWADVNSEDGPALLYRSDSDLRTWHEWCHEKGPDFGAGPSMNYDLYPGQYTMWWSDLLRGEPEHYWRSPIHMPRWASRLTLKVTDVRVQRLHDMPRGDVYAEGLTEDYVHHFRQWFSDQAPWESFAVRWDEINGKRSPWSSNPWVWAITFRMISNV